MMSKQKKVILMGNFSVGKSSLIRRYVDNSFSDKYISTIGVKISKKNITIDEENLMLLIWDIEGAVDHIKRVNKTYIKGASAAIIVTDILAENICNTLTMHIEDLYSVNSQIPIAIAINKIDIDNSFEVNLDDLKEQYPSIVESFYTSAKDNLNVDKMFIKLSKEIV